MPKNTKNFYSHKKKMSLIHYQNGTLEKEFFNHKTQSKSRIKSIFKLKKFFF